MRLYNTLTSSVEPLAMREPGRFTMYTCGPTPQEAPHFGHARAELTPDVLRRYLEWTGIEVFSVRNITDVEDKLINRGHELGQHPAAVAEAYTRMYLQQMARFGTLPPHIEPRATGHIIEMIDLITDLIERGAAYELDGDVYFPATGNCLAARSTSCAPGQGSRPTSAKKTLSTSRCGRQQSQGSRAGRPRGDRAVLAGTLSAPPCR